ncbi:MAG: LPS assembly lipoprotein LptE [Pseudomonadota bacterium]
MNAKTTGHASTARRAFLLGVTASSLTACGFQPRGAVELPPSLQRLHIGGPRAERGLVVSITRLLKQNGGQVVTDRETASMRLIVAEYRAARREVIIDPRARLREVELTLRVTVTAEDTQGHVLLASESFDAARMMHYDPNNLLGHSEEESRLRGEMQEAVAQSILARLRQKAIQARP